LPITVEYLSYFTQVRIIEIWILKYPAQAILTVGLIKYSIYSPVKAKSVKKGSVGQTEQKEAKLSLPIKIESDRRGSDTLANKCLR
jgi:hypothetical protein